MPPAPQAQAGLTAGRKWGVGLAVAAVVTLATPFVRSQEGRRLDPYYDIAGILTVCDGETRGVERRRYTDAQCDAITAAALTRHAQGISTCYPAARTPAGAQVAYLSLAYNIGVANFCASSVARLAKAGDLAGSCAAISRWDKVEDPRTHRLVVSKGLERRRHDERALCEAA
jgi:lysozyme